MENKTVDSESSEKSPIELVKEVHKELLEYRKPFEKEWREYDNAYYGKQHKTGEDKKTVKNHVFKIIEGSVPILTDSQPGVSITSNSEERQQDADNLNKSVKFVFQDQALQLRLPTLMRSALTSAPGYLYAFYNPDADGGDGKIEYRQLPWESVYLDGNVDLIEYSDKCRIEIPMRREAIARMWPEHRAKILETNSEKESTTSNNQDNLEDRDNSSESSSPGRPKRFKAKDVVKYVETYIKSYDLEPIPEEETQEDLAKETQDLLSGQSPNISKWENHPAHEQAHLQTRGEVLAQLQLPPDAPIELVSQTIDQLLQANPEAQDLAKILLTVKLIDNHLEEHAEMKKLNPKGERPKFKDGWRVIKSVDNTVLYDGPNPEENGHIPLIPFYCYKDDTIYGFGEVKNIIDPQRTLNDVDFRQLENIKNVSNSGWIADHEADVDAEKLTNEPGIVVLKKRGMEVRRLEPGIVSPELEQRKQTDAQIIEDISGVNRESQGDMAASASGVAIAKLQTQAIGRIRLKDRLLQQYSMRRLALITASLIINNWTTEKRLRLKSDNTNIEEFIFDPIAMQDLEYTIDISEGSMAGIDKDALNALYLQLFQVSGGAMGFDELLMVMDFPKRDILLAKIKEKMEQAQQLEQIQAQMQELQNQNIQLKGLINPNLVEGEEKKVFDMASKQALINQMIQQEQAAQAQQMDNQPGATDGQPVIQGNM